MAGDVTPGGASEGTDAGDRRASVRWVSIFLVRHAHAGSRSRWEEDDSLRPLSAKGRRQARHVLDLLRAAATGPLYSSPSRRCIETLEPLAELTGRPIKTVDVLDEGNTGTAAERFLIKHARENPVACSHGDVIPRVLQRLHAAGMRTDDDIYPAKGSVWVLDVNDKGSVVRGTYLPPQD
jgi:broad specificity phosphatase PhoE